MAEDFRAKVTAELDTAEAESKLNAFLNEKRKLKIDVKVNQDSAKKMASSIEKGIKDTKIDTSGISKQLAGSFNITDKNVISKLQSQMDKMISSLGKTWNGKDFDFGKASGFYSGMDSMVNTVTKNAKIVEGATGSYDAFFNYFKDKKIYVSDELKKAMGGDTYKELLQNNIGKIVRDASKGISIDSLWGEMRDLFPEHFSDNITNQVDQIVHAFDVLHQARADVGQVTTAQNMTAEQLTGISDSAAEQVVAIAAKLKESLQSNIMGTSEAAKTTIDLDVNVNTDKISSDIRSAVENAGNQAEGALKVNMEVNEEQLVSKIREALSSLATGEEPVKVNLQVNKESLQEDLNLALNEMDLPVHFKIDTEEIESQIRAAVESIQDMEIDLRVNTRDIQNDVDTAVNGATETPEIHVPEVDSSGLAQMQQALNGVNAAGIRGQSVFQSLGGSFREAFSAYSLANMMQDGLYKIVDAGKEAVSTVKEFDDLKTNLAMVTGKDKTYTEDLMQSYNELGQEIGSITSDVAESANTWLRQGRSMADTNQLIKDSMVLSKDAQISSEDAAQVLTSTLNGFKLGADQASRINDILTSIDLKSASDAGGIGTSLQKVASQANNVGMSLEKTAAIIATIKDVTQGSDETIGTSLKSILSRMNNIKAGKFVDDNGEALNDVEKVLNKIGITMRDNNDQFLDSETIIDSVADKWDTLNKNTQKAVSTALGGTHQANSVIAMLDNYDKVKMLTETAYNSEGTAEKKFQDNYLNSLEAKTNALKASLENLSTSLVSDNMYSGFLDGAKAMADFAANTDILQASLAGLASAGGVYAFQQLINLFREFSNMGQAMDISRMTEISTDSFEQLLGLTQGLSESQTRMVLSSTALTEAQRAAVLVNQGMSEAEAQAAVAAMGLTTANEAAAASTFTLSGAMEGMLATLMANPLILVAAGVTAAVTAYSAYKRSIEEAVSSAKSAGNTWEENTTSIQDNISRIQELRTALATGTLTEQEAADAKSELLSIQESLSESYGNQVSGLDLINGSLTEQIALLDQVNEKQSQSFLNENKKGIDKAQKEMEKNRHTYLGRFYDNGSEESEAIKKSIKNLQETYGEDVFKLDSADGITMDIQFNADASTAKDALNDFMTEVSGIEDQFGETDVTDQLANNAASGLTKAKDVLSKYQDIYKQAQEAELISDDKLYKSGDTEQKASKWISDYAKAVEDYNNAIADGDNSKISEASQKFSELDSTVNGLVKNTGMSAYADQVKEVRDELNDTAIANDKFTKAVNGTDAAEKVESWEDPWKNAVDWFERFTTKYNNSIDLNEAKAENYSSYENKNKYLDKEIADLSKLKGGYQQAQGYYKYQAGAYADMIGLSQDLRKKVQDGEINIDLLDEDTKSKVEAYQKWYDKIHECESELEKLKKKEKEVDQQKLDNITDRFDDLKKVYSTSSSVIESRLKYREENGESQAPGSKYYKDVNSQRKAQEAQAALLEKEMVAYRAQMEKIRKKYGEGHELYKKALAGYNDLRDELYSCKQSAKELSNTMYELKEKAAEYKTAMYQGRSDNLSSFRDYKEATNYKGSKYGDLTVNDYAQAAKTNDQTILALQNQKKIAMAKLKTLFYGSQEYNDKLDEINGYTQKILDLGKANAEFKKSAVEIRFKPFDDTIDSLDELIDDCDTLKDMLDSDTFFSDAGELTKQGAANIALINKGLNAEQQKIVDYRAQLKNAQQEYNAGNLTKEQLKEYQKQYKDGIKESSQAIYSYNQEMLKMYEDQVSKENDLLKENVDIRQKAKDAKEDYYQFDKTIKNKNKDINAIKAQIAALEGTTNAAAKAKLEQLKADLAEKEEDLEDTKHDHEIDLISKGYDNLTDQADKALDSTLNAVKSNSQMQTAVIEEMLKTTKQKYKDAYAEINQIIADTGLKVSDQFQNNIKDSNLKNEQTDKKKADKTVTGIKDTKVSGSTGTGNTSADKVIRNAATDAQDKTLKKLSLSPKSVVVNVGKTATVKVSFSPSTAVNKNFNCTASAKGIVKITQAADSITLKGLKAGKTVIKVQGAGGYCKAVSLNVSVLKDATKNSKIVNSTAKSKKYTLTTEEKNRVLNMSTGQNANTVKANTKKEAELKKWYKALPAYIGGDAEIEKIKDPLVKHLAKKGKKASNANIIKAASILGYRDAKNVSKWDTKKKNAMVKKLQTFGFSKGGVIRNLIPASMGTLLGDAIMKNGDTGFIGAKPGETVLTQDFTKLLKPTTATMQEFTEVMQKAGTPSVKETPVRQEVTMNNDYQFVINGVDVNDMSELKKVIRGELDKHDKELAKEFKKFR